MFKSKRFKKPTETSLQIHLNENEVETMNQLDLSENKRLERVRDLFIIGCCTGLRFSDFSKIRKENIREGFLNRFDFKGLRATLMGDWNNVQFFDPLMHKNQANAFKYRDPIYWKNISEKSRTTRCKHLNKLRSSNHQFGQNIQGKISDLIESKLNELSIDVFTFSHFSYMRNTSTPNTVCKITGIDISMQRSGSFLLSHTGLYHYIVKDFSLFEEVRKTYLSDKWIGSDLRIQIVEIVHNIRNKYFNREHRQKMRLERSKYEMFESDNHLRLRT